MSTARPAAMPASQPGLALAMSIAFRELRAGAGGLIIFVLSIALGVAAVASIGSLAASFDQALARQGRLLVGGDLSFERVHRRVNDEERAALTAQGTVSESASLRAMARSPNGKSALIEVKAVDGAYPLYGEVVITAGAGTPWREPGVVLVEQWLLDRLGAKVGDTLSIGETKVRVAGILGQQPDRLADRLSYGPKVLISLETLERTGLILPGSLIRWVYRLKLPDNRGDRRGLRKDAGGARGNSRLRRERSPLLPRRRAAPSCRAAAGALGPGARLGRAALRRALHAGGGRGARGPAAGADCRYRRRTRSSRRSLPSRRPASGDNAHRLGTSWRLRCKRARSTWKTPGAPPMSTRTGTSINGGRMRKPPDDGAWRLEDFRAATLMLGS